MRPKTSDFPPPLTLEERKARKAAILSERRQLQHDDGDEITPRAGALGAACGGGVGL